MQALLNSWGNPSKREIAGHVASALGLFVLFYALLVAVHVFGG